MELTLLRFAFTEGFIYHIHSTAIEILCHSSADPSPGFDACNSTSAQADKFCMHLTPEDVQFSGAAYFEPSVRYAELGVT
jgi:hypothetical protein